MKSMTGFGRAESILAGHHFTVEAKSVNHRYLDLRFRLPPSLSLYESLFAESVRGRFERGAFEITVKQKLAGQGSVAGTRFVVDETAAKSLADACARLHQAVGTPSVPTLEMMVATNKVFLPVEETEDNSTLLQALRPLLDLALDGLKKMRETEGARLKEILKEGAAELLTLTDRAALLAPEQPKRIQERLTQRIAQWTLPGNADPQRLEWEIAFFAERSDITEEIDRLRTHAREFTRLLDEPKGVGRRLDFLTQEMHREMNTMGSKASLLELTRLTVEGKTSIEKLREQVQNVE